MACNMDGIVLIEHLIYVLAISSTVKSMPAQSPHYQGWAVQKYCATPNALAFGKPELLQHWVFLL